MLDFGRKNGAKLAPKSDQKSTSTLKAKNQLNISRLDFSWFQGVEVGSKNRPKMNQKMESKMIYILASILERFWWILATKLGTKCLQEAPRHPNLALRTAQEPPKRRPRRLKNRPRAAQEVSRNQPRGALVPQDAQEPPRIPTYLDFAPFWRRFWSICVRFLEDFERSF